MWSVFHDSQTKYFWAFLNVKEVVAEAKQQLGYCGSLRNADAKRSSLF